MVILTLLAIGAGAVAFFAGGGVQKVKALREQVPIKIQKKFGTAVVPTIESGEGTVPIASGSQRTVSNINDQDILRTSVADKRKFSPQADKEPIKTFFNNPIQGGSEPQTGQIVGSNTSIEKTTKFGQGQFGLSKQEITTIRNKDFTDQEKQDIANLTLRFNRKSVSAQKVSDSPTEIIFKKREQNELAKKLIRDQLGAGSFTTVEQFFTPAGFSLTGGKPTQQKLFAKPNFIFGGVSEEVFLQQRKEKAEELVRIQEVQRLQAERTARGDVILRGISASGTTQREFLLARGIALRGSELNARALARLQERGLI